jgi:hypothetical protein
MDRSSRDEVINEYKKKTVLTVQDVIKCCLRLHQLETGNIFYDCREKLWKMRPGDVIFTKGSFQPLMSYPRIDDTLKGVRCGHMEENDMLSSSKKKKSVPVPCKCRKWYLYYKTDDGKVKKVYPQWDGMTVIKAGKVDEVMSEFATRRSIGNLETHFKSGYVGSGIVQQIMREIRLWGK